MFIQLLCSCIHLLAAERLEFGFFGAVDGFPGEDASVFIIRPEVDRHRRLEQVVRADVQHALATHDDARCTGFSVL